MASWRDTGAQSVIGRLAPRASCGARGSTGNNLAPVPRYRPNTFFDSHGAPASRFPFAIDHPARAIPDPLEHRADRRNSRSPQQDDRTARKYPSHRRYRHAKRRWPPGKRDSVQPSGPCRYPGFKDLPRDVWVWRHPSHGWFAIGPWVHGHSRLLRVRWCVRALVVIAGWRVRPSDTRSPPMSAKNCVFGVDRKGVSAHGGATASGPGLLWAAPLTRGA